MSEITINSVREELGNPDKEIVSDEKVMQIINDEQSFYGSVARVAKIIANYFSLKATRKMGPLSIDYQERAETWLAIAKDYTGMIALEGDPYAGGISESDKEAKNANSDLSDYAFKRGMFEIGSDFYE